MVELCTVVDVVVLRMQVGLSELATEELEVTGGKVVVSEGSLQPDELEVQQQRRSEFIGGVAEHVDENDVEHTPLVLIEGVYDRLVDKTEVQVFCKDVIT